MERLSFGPATRYDALEAAIHVARYGAVRQLCRGRSVLDLACGEGYGARLLADWGASAVVGADVSGEAIARAGEMFASPAVEFVLLDERPLEAALGGRRFDLVVSLETVEHVPDAPAFLRELRGRLAPGGTLVVSCPNDWWYFPNEGESNPYHRRKYTFDEFRALAEGELGRADAWYLGTGASGYCNVAIDRIPALGPDAPQDRMLDARAAGAMMVPAGPGQAPTPGDASYFIGAWGADAHRLETAALMPLGMDAFAARLSPNGAPADAGDERAWRRLVELKEVEARLRALAEQRIEPLAARLHGDPLDEAAARRAALLADALARENALLRERVHELEAAASAASASPSWDGSGGQAARVDVERAEARLALAERELERLRRQLAILQQACAERDALLEASREEHRLATQEIEHVLAGRSRHFLEYEARLAALGSERERIEAELERFRAERDRLLAERDQLMLPAQRYLRLSRMLPPSLRRAAVRVVRAARRP